MFTFKTTDSNHLQKYVKIYFDLCNRAKFRKIDNVGTEIHHITPRQLGGTDDADNLVKLTLREHFICHKILSLITISRDKRKMLKALYMMSNTRGLRLNSKIYSECKHSVSEYMKNRIVSEKTKKKISDFRKQYWIDNREILLEQCNRESTRKIIQEKVSRYIQNNYDEFYQKMLRINRNPEKIKKTAEKHRGMKRSDTTKHKQSIKKKQFIEKNSGPSNKGKVHYHNPLTGEQIQIEKSIIPPIGFISGLGQKYKPRGKWFNNGLDLKMFYDGQEIPSGWSKGRLKTRKVVIHV